MNDGDFRKLRDRTIMYLKLVIGCLIMLAVCAILFEIMY